MKYLLVVCYLRHRIGNAGIHVAKDYVDIVDVDQFARFLHAGADIIGRVLDEKLNRAAEDAAIFVDLSFRIFGAVNFALRERRQDAGERIDHADLDQFVTASREDERCAQELTGAKRKARLDDAAPADRHYCLAHLNPFPSLVIPNQIFPP